jgi:hypothetical protein
MAPDKMACSTARITNGSGRRNCRAVICIYQFGMAAEPLCIKSSSFDIG